MRIRIIIMEEKLEELKFLSEKLEESLFEIKDLYETICDSILYNADNSGDCSHLVSIVAICKDRLDKFVIAYENLSIKTVQLKII